MSAGCGCEALSALQCADGGPWRSKGSLEKMHPTKNFVSGNSVVASVDATDFAMSLPAPADKDKDKDRRQKTERQKREERREKRED